MTTERLQLKLEGADEILTYSVQKYVYVSLLHSYYIIQSLIKDRWQGKRNPPGRLRETVCQAMCPASRKSRISRASSSPAGVPTGWYSVTSASNVALEPSSAAGGAPGAPRLPKASASRLTPCAACANLGPTLQMDPGPARSSRRS